MKEVFNNQEEVQYPNLAFRRVVFKLLLIDKVEEIILQFLVAFVNYIQRHNQPINDHDDHLEEESHYHVARELGYCEQLSDRFAVVTGLELHHIVAEEYVEQN